MFSNTPSTVMVKGFMNLIDYLRVYIQFVHKLITVCFNREGEEGQRERLDVNIYGKRVVDSVKADAETHIITIIVGHNSKRGL